MTSVPTAMRGVGIFFMSTAPFLLMRLLDVPITRNDGALGRFFFWDPANIVYEAVLMGMTFVWGLFLFRAASRATESLALVDMTIWATAVHATVMGIYAVAHPGEWWHLVGDVFFLAASVVWLAVARRSATRA